MDDLSRRAILDDPSVRIERDFVTRVHVELRFDADGPVPRELAATRALDPALASRPTRAVVAQLKGARSHSLGSYDALEGQRLVRRAEELGLRVQFRLAREPRLHICNADGDLQLEEDAARRALIDALLARGVPITERRT